MDPNLYTEEDDDFSDIPHRHNFSALNSFKVPAETEDDRKKKEIMSKIHKYPYLFDGMYDLLYQSTIQGDDLDEEYETLKQWQSFM